MSLLNSVSHSKRSTFPSLRSRHFRNGVLIRRLHLRDIFAWLIIVGIYHQAATSFASRSNSRISRFPMWIHGSVSTKKHPRSRYDRRACKSYFGVEPGKEAVHRVRDFFPLLSPLSLRGATYAHA